jgi:hypothetical protein
MGSIVDFIPADRAFDPEATANLCAAFDRACRQLQDTGQPEVVRHVIAKRIIAIAGRGEHDPGRLCEATLASLGLQRVPTPAP